MVIANLRLCILIVSDTVDEPQEEDVDAGNEEDENCDTDDFVKGIGTHSIT